MTRLPHVRAALRLAGALSCAAAPCVVAQEASAPASAPCDGAIVSRVDIRPARPPFEGSAARWRNAARAIGLHHTTTQARVIAAFLALREGTVCTERRRTVSERVLRAQPFIADATVRAVPDGPGRVAIVVETTDEVSLLLGAQLRGIVPRALSLGSSNVAGEGLLAQVSVERGYAYQTGLGLRLVDYATFDRPYVATFEAIRRTIGYDVNTSLEHPFYTDLQRVGWHAGFRTSNDYPGLRRPANDPLALSVHQQRWDASSLTRVFGLRVATLLGIGASGLHVTPDSMGIVVSDTGFAPDTGTTLRGKYLPFRSGRLGVLGGIGLVNFRTVRGFDGLTAQQDVASGVMTGLFVAHGLPAFGENDMFLSGAAYVGKATDHSLVAALGQVEGRHGQGEGNWDSIIGSARAALYLGDAPGWVMIVDDRFSGGSRSRLPLQLALGDRQGGMLGYYSSPLAGAQRNVARTELRMSRSGVIHDADLGVGAFGEVGSIWAGDAPYGTTATRTTLGVSLLAAYPSRSKRLYRADLGIPLARRGERGGHIELRFSSEDRTTGFWREPDDVSRARTGAVPSSLFAWPVR
jgi:hypothetical protein